MPRPRPNHAPGQCIYAYCNVKTKQVLYSLTRQLQHKHLRQLPDTGANNNPPNLRKDLWRPLYSVHLPENEHGAAQGLAAYKKLREFRMLHETTWEPPKQMSVPYTEKQIEKLERRLEQRGGSKKESPYDLIARRKWKMRVQMVMNQKANSIADLAAVLLKQEADVDVQLEKLEFARQKEIQEMQRLADLWEQDDGAGRKALEVEIKRLQDAHASPAPGQSRRSLERKLDAARFRLNRMEFAAKSIAEGHKRADDATAAEQARIEALIAKRKADAEAKAAALEADSATADTPAEETTAAEEAEPEPEMFVWHHFVPLFPPELREPTKYKPRETPKPYMPAVFDLEGVTVRWANTLDAEYAAQWPALVKHEPMGFLRNVAPAANENNTHLEVADFRASVGKKTWEKSLMKRLDIEPTLLTKIRERRKEMGMGDLSRYSLRENTLTKAEVRAAKGLFVGDNGLLRTAPKEEPAGEDGEVVEYDHVAADLRRHKFLQRLSKNVFEKVKGPASDRKGQPLMFTPGADSAPEVRV